MNPSLISVVVPAYNEGSCIQSNLDRIVQYLDARFSRFEIIVVNDGSTDETQSRVVQAANKDCRVKVLSFSANRGKGAAVREGITKAKGDVILFTDADLSTPLAEIETALGKLAKGYPVVIGSRQHPGSKILVHQGWFRERFGVIFNLFVRFLLPLPFKDTQCGFKCFTQKAGKEIFAMTEIDGLTFDVEVLLIAQRLHYPVKEIPICWTNSATSKVRVMQNLLGVVSELLTIYWNDMRGLYGPKSLQACKDS